MKSGCSNLILDSGRRRHFVVPIHKLFFVFYDVPHMRENQFSVDSEKRIDTSSLKRLVPYAAIDLAERDLGAMKPSLQ